MIKVGICGSGFMGRMHAQCYSLIPGVKLVAVASKDKASAAAFAQLHGAHIYRDARELIREAEVDVVDLCLPTYLHARYAVQAAQRGRAIFCEKPLARTLPEADRIVRAVKKAGVPFMAGHCIRFWPEYVTLKEFHDGGRLGRLLSLSLRRVQGKVTFGWKNWFNRPKLSGCSTLDFHIHDVDYLRYLLGDPLGVQCIATYRWCSVNYLYPGMIVSSEAGWSSADPFEMTFRAVFEKGVLLYSSRLEPLTLYRDGRPPERVKVKGPKVGEAAAGGNISTMAAYYSELKYFIDCLESRRTPDAVDVVEARNSLALVLKEMASAKPRGLR